MATIEKNTLLSVKDNEGNLVLLYPTTEAAFVMYNNSTIEEAVSNLEGNSETYAYKSEIRKGKLFASSWVDNAYAFPEYPASLYDIEIFLDGDATQEELDAYAKAMLVGNVINNKLKAFGDAPVIDIPVVIKSTQKNNELFGTDIFIVMNNTTGDGGDAITVGNDLKMDIYRGSTLIGQTEKYWGISSFAFSIEYTEENTPTQILQNECKFIITSTLSGSPAKIPITNYSVLEEDGILKVVIPVDEELSQKLNGTV